MARGGLTSIHCHVHVATCMYTSNNPQSHADVHLATVTLIYSDSGILRGSTWRERVKESELGHTPIKTHPCHKSKHIPLHPTCMSGGIGLTEYTYHTTCHSQLLNYGHQ